MGATSNLAKQRWNNSHYVQVKVSVQPEIAVAFKARCLADNVSMASEISKFMAGQDTVKLARKTSKAPYATRQNRRKALNSLIQQLHAMMCAEQGYLENIPQNFRGSQTYEDAENSISAFEEALEILEGAY
jgi:hypothetical protein